MFSPDLKFCQNEVFIWFKTERTIIYVFTLDVNERYRIGNIMLHDFPFSSLNASNLISPFCLVAYFYQIGYGLKSCLAASTTITSKHVWIVLERNGSKEGNITFYMVFRIVLKKVEKKRNTA